MSVPALSGQSSVLAVLSTALDGLSERQRVIADNIANVDTPGFRATSVDFESSLREAVRSGSGEGIALEASYQPTATPVGPDGNSVDLRKEMLAASQTQFQYQLLSRAVSDQYAVLRTAAGA